MNKVVDETSACIDGYLKVPLPTDHFKINKFTGPDDPAYEKVYPLIMDMAQKAVQVVQGRLSRKHGFKCTYIPKLTCAQLRRLSKTIQVRRVVGMSIECID